MSLPPLEPASTAHVVIVGGGPAGMVAGLLLARRGVRVTVLEKHADFLRDFRGDTVHPSTLELFAELGLVEQFLTRPHQRVETLAVQIGDCSYAVADFRRVPTRCKFIALMPQWDFLDFVAAEAGKLPGFTLLRSYSGVGLIQAKGRVAGVRVAGPSGEQALAADLVVLADGRGSKLRLEAGLVPRDLGAPIDVLWFRVGKQAGDAPGTGGRLARGVFLVQIDRGDYWQCAYVIAKGQGAVLEGAGLAELAARVGRVAPELAARVVALGSWDAVKLLTVTVDRLDRWWVPGLAVIGDAAHAMSPVGGVGINLAVQDAIALANRLGPALARGADVTALLSGIAVRRRGPVRFIQRLQIAAHNRIIVPTLAPGAPLSAPLPLRLIARSPWLQRRIGAMIGVGIGRERVDL